MLVNVRAKRLSKLLVMPGLEHLGYLGVVDREVTASIGKSSFLNPLTAGTQG
jgi:hypothetical protein